MAKAVGVGRLSSSGVVENGISEWRNWASGALFSFSGSEGTNGRADLGEGSRNNTDWQHGLVDLCIQNLEAQRKLEIVRCMG